MERPAVAVPVREILSHIRDVPRPQYFLSHAPGVLGLVGLPESPARSQGADEELAVGIGPTEELSQRLLQIVSVQEVQHTGHVDSAKVYVLEVERWQMTEAHLEPGPLLGGRAPGGLPERGGIP